MERNDLDIPQETVWPATDEGAEVIELGPGEDGGGDGGGDEPMSLDPERTQVDRNAASGGWDGATEQVENDFETEQLRQQREATGGGEQDATPEIDSDAAPLT